MYIWGFLCIGITFVVYTYTFWALRQKQQSSRFMPPSSSETPARNISSSTRTNTFRPSGHHPAFLVYPLIYVCCASPMTIGSITPLEQSTAFMTVAGILLASMGLLNAILWSTMIIFSQKEDMVNTGLDNFAFIRTPENRSFGNMIWVQGAVHASSSTKSTNGNKWWVLSRSRNNSDTEIPLRDTRSPSVPQCQPGAIQLDVSTTVEIEDERMMSRRWKTP